MWHDVVQMRFRVKLASVNPFLSEQLEDTVFAVGLSIK